MPSAKGPHLVWESNPLVVRRLPTYYSRNGNLSPMSIMVWSLYCYLVKLSATLLDMTESRLQITAASHASCCSWCPGRSLSLSGLVWEQRLVLCAAGRHWEQRGVWLRHSRADGDSGHTGSRPFIAVMLGPSPNCGELAGVRQVEARGSDWGRLLQKRVEGREGGEQGQGRVREMVAH